MIRTIISMKRLWILLCIGMLTTAASAQLANELLKSESILQAVNGGVKVDKETESKKSLLEEQKLESQRLLGESGFVNGRYESFLDTSDMERYLLSPLSPIEKVYESILKKSFTYQVRVESESLDSLTKINSRIDELERMSLLGKTAEEINSYNTEKDELLQKRDRLEIQRRKNSIRQFGYNTFSRASEEKFTYEGVPPDYILGPGDQLTLYLWGKIEQTLELELDRNGRVYLSRIGHVSLMGVRFSDAAKVLKSELESEFVNFELSVSMKKLKSISIFVLGDVEQPGKVTVPSTASIFHLLHSAGGPSKSGSLRGIKIVRNGKVIQTVDFYNYLIFGNNKQSVSIQNNDTIFIPSIQNTVLIDGAVNRKGIYEFSKSLNAKQLIELSGGFSLNSSQQRIQILRFESNGSQSVIDIDSHNANFTKQLIKTKIKNGDMVSVFSVVEKIKNYVQIDGNVLRPGRYGYTSGMTLKDVIKKSAGLDEDTYLERVDIYRFVSKNKRRIVTAHLLDKEALLTPIHDQDVVRIYSNLEAYGESIVRISGAVRDPGEYKLLEGMTVVDLVFMAKLDTFADQGLVEVYRREVGMKPNLITIPLKDIIKNPRSVKNILLKDEDQLNIKLDATALKKRYITLEGEVKYPGTYIAREGELLSSILERAGGFTKNAFLPGAVFTRKSTQAGQMAGQLNVVADEKKRFIYDQNHLSSVTTDAAQAYQAVLASREKALVVLEEQVQNKKGRIIINLKPLEKFKGTLSDIEIEDGDKVVVPEFPESIHLVGGVKNPSSLIFKKGESGRYYINQVGGYSPYADKSNVYVFKPNGSVEIGLNRIEAGDTIYVAEEVKIKVNWIQFVSNIADILGKTATAVATVKVLQQ